MDEMDETSLLIGIPVVEFPDYPHTSKTKTTYSAVRCHHCYNFVWLGERQIKKQDAREGIPICPSCAVLFYGVTPGTPMTPLTHERKSDDS